MDADLSHLEPTPNIVVTFTKVVLRNSRAEQSSYRLEYSVLIREEMATL
jgi:hypothetical protein